VPASQEVLAGRDHLGGIPGARTGPSRDEVHVALAGDVEAMPALADDLAAVEPDRPGAYRAPQPFRDRAERRPPLGRRDRPPAPGTAPGLRTAPAPGTVSPRLACSPATHDRQA
jgi:hypothetical protein